MTDLSGRVSRWSFSLMVLSWMVLVCGRADAQVPVTGYVVINPIDVCGSTGPTSATGCAPFNTAHTLPSQATSTTPIGFVDPSTNINLTRAIWLQAGIDITFFPIVEYNNTSFQNIGDVTSTTPLYSCSFDALSNGGVTPPAGVNCTGTMAASKVPLASKNSNAINMFFVNTINNGALFGFGWLNHNGLAIGANVFSASQPRFDTMAHELGHNFALDHTTFGAGWSYTTSTGVACTGSTSQLPTPGGCNLMDSGTIRNVAVSSGCTGASTSSPSGGELYDLDTMLYLLTDPCGKPSVPYPPIADNLIPTSQDTSTFISQQTQAKLTGFINPTPNVNASAGGGSTTTAATFTASSNSSPNKSITITIRNEGGGRDSEGEFINNIVFAFANGISPAGKNALVSSNSGQFGEPVVINAFNLNGNNGENPNCEKQTGLAGPAVHCYEIQYQPGTFRAHTTSVLVLNLTQNNQPLTNPQALTGSQFTPLLETDQAGTIAGTMPIALFATTSIFNGAAQASTQFPDPTTASVLLSDPGTFTGAPYPNTSTQIPCTPQFSENTFTCPPPAGGVGGDGSGD